MGFKKFFLSLLSVLMFATPTLAASLDEYAGYMTNLRDSLENVSTARAYLESRSLWSGSNEKELGDVTIKVHMAASSIAQASLPGISFADIRGRNNAFCDYTYDGRRGWERLNKSIGSVENQKPEWQSLYKKAIKDLPYGPCD